MSSTPDDTKGFQLGDGRTRWLRGKERVPGLASRLRRARIGASLTQEQLAETLSVNRRTVYTWEAGRSEPTVARLEEIATALNKPTEWLLEGEGDDRTSRLDSLRNRLDDLPDTSLDVLEEFLSTLERSIDPI